MKIEAEVPTPPIRVPVRWPLIGKVVLWIVPVVMSGSMVYLRSQFASHEDVANAVAPLATRDQVEQVRVVIRNTADINPRVTSLEEYRSRAEHESRGVANQLQTISNAQSAQAATLSEIGKAQERILNRLEQLADRMQK